MVTTVKAKFSKGVFRPLEKIDFPEGKEVTIAVESDDKEIKNFIDALDSTAGAWKEIIDCEKLEKDIYEARSVSTRSVVGL